MPPPILSLSPSPQEPPSSRAASAPTRSTSPNSSSERSNTKASPSSMSSAPASPTITTTPSSGFAHASRNWKITRPTTPPIGRQQSKNPSSGATKYPSASSSSATTFPQRTMQTPS